MMFWNTTFNRKYTFQSDVKYRTAIAKLLIFYAFFIPLSTWGGNTLVDMQWNAYVILFITMGVNLTLAFFYNKYVIYR